ncbi:MAG: hypothetical protein HY426_00115 [Candidatus Levybacteria bacterium]|nr:hypothetical protein [Candidatus Levybacteria bacterium]
MAAKNKQNFFKSPLSITVIAFVILFVIFFSFYSKSYNSNINQNTNVSNETTDWKTYSNNIYSIKYPSSWTASIDESGGISNNPIGGRKDLTLKGLEGNVYIGQIDVYGGGCDPSMHKKMQLGNLEIEDGCQGKMNENDKETWNGSKELDSNTHLGILVNAEAYQPTKENRSVVIRILSTLKVTDQ